MITFFLNRHCVRAQILDEILGRFEGSSFSVDVVNHKTIHHIGNLTVHEHVTTLARSVISDGR